MTTMKHIKQKKRGIFTLLPYRGYLYFAVLVIALVLAIVFAVKGCSKKNDSAGKNSDASNSVVSLSGTYYCDDYTRYYFDGKGAGALLLGESKRLEYKYTVDDKTIHLEYENDDKTKVDYVYKLHGEDLTITSDAGTFELKHK